MARRATARARKRSKESRARSRSTCRVIGRAHSSRNWSKKARCGWKAPTEKILALYARGMTTHDIQAQLQELSGVEISPTLISNATEAVMEEVQQTAKPPAGSHLSDCLSGLPGRTAVKENQRGSLKAVYLALDCPLAGTRDSPHSMP